MKVVLQYTIEDLQRLVAADAAKQGYAVRSEDVDLPPDVSAIVRYTGVPTPPAAPVEAVVAAAPPAAPTAAPPVPPVPPAPPAPPVPVPGGPPLPGAPPGTHGWSSQHPAGGDPRYVPPPPPTESERVPRVRELGKQTGLVRRQTGTDDGRPAGWAPPVTVDIPEALPPSEASFLDDYIKPPLGG